MNSADLTGLESNLEKLIFQARGKRINFDNGCTIWLIDDNGVFWGTNPYGLDWACNVSDNWVKSILNWVKYWDESRDETGALIK